MAYEIEPMDGAVECYCCGDEIPKGATNWGWTWGSDGVFPDGASSMYACWNCRDLWQDWIRDAAERGSRISEEKESL